MWYSRLFSSMGGAGRMKTMTRTNTVSSSQSSSPLLYSIFPRCVVNASGGTTNTNNISNNYSTLIINNIGLSLFQQPATITTTVLPTALQPTIQRRYMSKYLSKAATKRLPLTTKRAGKGYYKGKGCTSEGRLTSKGKFIGNPLKKLHLIVPTMTDMAGFSLKPYIARSVGKSPSTSCSTKKENGQLVLGDGQ
jgi:hypothetical protein